MDKDYASYFVRLEGMLDAIKFHAAHLDAGTRGAMDAHHINGIKREIARFSGLEAEINKPFNPLAIAAE